MKIRRVTLTEAPYPTCVVSGKQLQDFNATFEVTRDDGEVVYVHVDAFNALNGSLKI